MKRNASILIEPWSGPLRAKVSVPGSKSLTNRVLVLAALKNGVTTLRGALWSEDTERMVDCLQRLGIVVEVQPDPTNSCNRFLIVNGQGGRIPAKEADLDVGTAGTVARFLAPFCALGSGRYRLNGTPRMHERPMREVFDGIRVLGGRVEDSDGKLPAVISGPMNSGRLSVPAVESSQSASGFILISRAAGLVVDCPSSPYVEMTRHLLREWDDSKSFWDIEPDASSASYFWALHHLLGTAENPGRLEIERWPLVSTQIDHRMPRFLPVPEHISRKTDLGDAVMTAVIAAAASRRRLHLIEAGNLRKQECDRISALATELGKCGVITKESPEELWVESESKFRPAEIDTYKDHRMAMCFAVLGSLPLCGANRPWITIRDPDCVQKTFPNFFETLAEAKRQSEA